jgi:phage terminase small subunit
MAGTKPKLTPKQEKFCQEYMIDLNATQAAIRAGYSKDTANRIASENLTKPDIQEFITILRLETSKRTEITIDAVLNEYRKLAMFDVRKLYNDDGSIKSVSDLDDDTAGAIIGIEVIEGEFTNTKKVKLSDKKGALDSICKVLGFNAPDKSVVEMGIVWNEEKTYKES